MFNDNNNQGLEFLDGLNIVSFVAQILNIAQDEEQGKYTHKVIQAIAYEIEKLHQENDIIMKQNEEIIKLLKEK